MCVCMYVCVCACDKHTYICMDRYVVLSKTKILVNFRSISVNLAMVFHSEIHLNIKQLRSLAKRSIFHVESVS